MMASGKPNGYLAIVLHAHLPYVHHPEHDRFLEEYWLFEAVTECYLPLLAMLERLASDEVHCRLTLSLSPTLITMLQTPLLLERYERRLNEQIALARLEVERTADEPRINHLAKRHLNRFRLCLKQFSDTSNRHGDLVGAFHHYAGRGLLDLITTCATHGFLPLLKTHASSVRAQIETGRAVFTRALGMDPQGIWLPECGYYPGVEEFLKDAGYGYFFVDAHGLTQGRPEPGSRRPASTLLPLVCPNGVAAFARDAETSEQVWSAEGGYPGDFDYLDFFRDIGFDREPDYLEPFLPNPGESAALGIKYHRITGPTPDKAPYDPAKALDKTRLQADHFVNTLNERLATWTKKHAAGSTLKGPAADTPQGDSGTDNPLPIVTAPYDAELFGHWWHEGPSWLEAVIRKIDADEAVGVRLATPADYLKQAGAMVEVPAKSAPGQEEPEPERATRDPEPEEKPEQPEPWKLPIGQPCASTWGYKGYNAFWINDANDWIYPYLDRACEQMEYLSAMFRFHAPPTGSLQSRAMRQAARSLLLAQSSDWPFILRSGTTMEYARDRLRSHLSRFHFIAKTILNNQVDDTALSALEILDNIFPQVDFQLFDPGDLPEGA